MNPGYGTVGTDSTFFSLTAKGGGRGAASNVVGQPGGSGSGGGGTDGGSNLAGGATTQGCQPGNSGTYGYGYAGGGAINLEPASGSVILLDGTISVDAGVVTGATSITSTAFVGDITGDVTGTADTATVGTSVTVTDNAETAETVYICFVDGTSGTQGIEIESKLTYNPSTTALDGVLINAGTYSAA